MLHKVKPAAIGAQRASVFVNWQVGGGAEDNPSQVSRQAIRAELTGSDGCSALGLAINSSSPVLALCRALIEAGHDPATPLEVYRGETLSLRVRSIGEGAGLQVNSQGRGFEPYQGPRPASPMRQNRRGA
jgi:hypothetical protein